MSYKTTLSYAPIKSRDSATFTGSYQTLGSAFTQPKSLIKIVNNSTVAVTISTDGTNDNDFIPAGSFALYDITTNSPVGIPGVFFPIGTQFFVKGSAGTGSVYLVSMYTQTV